LFKNHIEENRRGLPFILTVSPHRITTVELVISVGTHLRVLDDVVKVVIFFIYTNFRLILK